MLEEFCERLQAALEVLIQEKSEVVADGAASDFVDYKARCAEIDGLKRAQRMVEEERRRILEEDDDD